MISKSRLILLTATCAVLVLVVLATGCGDSDESSADEIDTTPIESVPTSSLTKARYVQRANAVCIAAVEKVKPEIGNYLRSHDLGIRRDEALPYAEELFSKFTAPQYESVIDGIRSLGAPKGDEQQIVKILNAMQRGAAEAEKDPAVLYFANETPMDRAADLARAYGLSDCPAG